MRRNELIINPAKKKNTEQRGKKILANNQIPSLWTGKEAQFRAQTWAETSSVMQ